jgi:hypothetical protein
VLALDAVTGVVPIIVAPEVAPEVAPKVAIELGLEVCHFAFLGSPTVEASPRCAIRDITQPM